MLLDDLFDYELKGSHDIYPCACKLASTLTIRYLLFSFSCPTFRRMLHAFHKLLSPNIEDKLWPLHTDMGRQIIMVLFPAIMILIALGNDNR